MANVAGACNVLRQTVNTQNACQALRRGSTFNKEANKSRLVHPGDPQGLTATRGVGPSDQFRARTMTIMKMIPPKVDTSTMRNESDALEDFEERRTFELEGQAKLASFDDQVEYQRRSREVKPWWIVDPRVSRLMTYWDSTTAVRRAKSPDDHPTQQDMGVFCPLGLCFVLCVTPAARASSAMG